MNKNLSEFTGCPDYTGATLEEIIENINNMWIYRIESVIDRLEKLKEDVEKNYQYLEDGESIRFHVDYFIKVFLSYKSDFQRLAIELPLKVEERHLSLIKELHARSSSEKHFNREFKNEQICRKLKDESQRPLIDKIYSSIAIELNQYPYLPDLIRRLSTFIGSKVKNQNVEIHNDIDEYRFPTPSGITWEDVTIRFIDENEVHIRAGSVSVKKNFAQMGFEFRNQGRGDKIWDTLREFSKNQGSISWDEAVIQRQKIDTHKKSISLDVVAFQRKKIDAHKKRISELRKRLKSYFQISEDPITPYHKHHAYRTRFQVFEIIKEDDDE